MLLHILTTLNTNNINEKSYRYPSSGPGGVRRYQCLVATTASLSSASSLSCTCTIKMKTLTFDFCIVSIQVIALRWMSVFSSQQHSALIRSIQLNKDCITSVTAEANLQLRNDRDPAYLEPIRLLPGGLIGYNIQVGGGSHFRHTTSVLLQECRKRKQNLPREEAPPPLFFYQSIKINK